MACGPSVGTGHDRYDRMSYETATVSGTPTFVSHSP
jgi:hypothetical protein